MNILPENLTWFNGVVEDRMDPQQMGRVRVRCIGVHPFKKAQDDLEGVPTEELPWMVCLLPITSAAMDGISGSITGLVEGSHVFGLWLDKYKTNGIVLGATSGFYTEKPNPEEGFADPNGQYPMTLGPTAAALNMGNRDPSINGQDGSGTAGIDPDGTTGGIVLSGDHDTILKSILKFDEGFSESFHWDVKGYSIGHGHQCASGPKGQATLNQAITNLNKALSRSSGDKVTRDEAAKLLDQAVSTVRSEINRIASIKEAYNACDTQARKIAVECMVFQMGASSVAQFTTSLDLIKSKSWDKAAEELKKTKWYSQTTQRASRVIGMLKHGDFRTYSNVTGNVQGTSSPTSGTVANSSGVSGGSNLRGVDSRLVNVIRKAASYGTVKFTVLEGVRTQARQRQLVAQGLSKTMNSRHLTGHAVDLAPLVNGKVTWNWQYYYPLAQVMARAATELGVDIRWGGAWTNIRGKSGTPQSWVNAYKSSGGRFLDGPHFEIPR